MAANETEADVLQRANGASDGNKKQHKKKKAKGKLKIAYNNNKQRRRQQNGNCILKLPRLKWHAASFVTPIAIGGGSRGPSKSPLTANCLPVSHTTRIRYFLAKKNSPSSQKKADEKIYEKFSLKSLSLHLSLFSLAPAEKANKLRTLTA